MKKILCLLAALAISMSGCCGACFVAGGASLAGAYAVKKRADSLKKTEEQEVVGRLIKESEERFQQRDWDEVIRLTSEAVKLDSTSELAHVLRAGAYAETGLYEEAIKDCNTAIQSNPDFGLAYYNRGYSLELLGRFEEAALDYEKSCGLGVDLGCQNHRRLCKCKCGS